MSEAWKGEIEELKEKTNELTDRAQILSNAIGIYRGITENLTDDVLNTFPHLYFRLSRYFAIQIIIIHSCALLQKNNTRQDDATLWEFYQFLRNEDRTEFLIKYRCENNTSLGSHYANVAKSNRDKFLKEMNSISDIELTSYYNFRSKRIAHSTMTIVDDPPKIGTALSLARKAIRCADLAYVLFAQTGFDHAGSEEMACRSAKRAVAPHIRRSGSLKSGELNDE